MGGVHCSRCVLGGCSGEMAGGVGADMEQAAHPLQNWKSAHFMCQSTLWLAHQAWHIGAGGTVGGAGDGGRTGGGDGIGKCGEGGGGWHGSGGGDGRGGGGGNGDGGGGGGRTLVMVRAAPSRAADSNMHMLYRLHW